MKYRTREAVQLAGSKLMRAGKLWRWMGQWRNTEKFWEQLSQEAGNPAKRAYYDGKLDALREVLAALEGEIPKQGEGTGT